MSEQERKQAFATAMDKLCAEMGIEVQIDTEVKRFGEMVQVVPVMRIVVKPAPPKNAE